MPSSKQRASPPRAATPRASVRTPTRRSPGRRFEDGFKVTPRAVGFMAAILGLAYSVGRPIYTVVATLDRVAAIVQRIDANDSRQDTALGEYREFRASIEQSKVSAEKKHDEYDRHFLALDATLAGLVTRSAR